MKIIKKIAAAGLALLLALACSVFAYAEESTFTNKTAPDGGNVIKINTLREGQKGLTIRK